MTFFYGNEKLKTEHLRVIVRCRPMNEKEVDSGFSKVVNVLPSSRSIQIFNPKEDDTVGKLFTYDAVYDSTSTQTQLYNESIRPIVNSVLSGFNATIFAYGQTGTGKTFTMEGDKYNPDLMGVIPKSFQHIFSHISASELDLQYIVSASYLEIYKEEMRDLLDKGKRRTYEVREDRTGIYIKNLRWHRCKNIRQLENVMRVGNRNRKIGSTAMNKHSSRSHAIFIITVEMCKFVKGTKHRVRFGKLNLVDLAGSERQSKTNTSGNRLKEATKINLSLSALGNVILALGRRQLHIPYRNSKLTRILQDSLGGNSKTLMIANIGPASYNYDESLTTLMYANRARKIKNCPRINENSKDKLIRFYQNEIIRLKALIVDRQREAAILAEKKRLENKENEDLEEEETESQRGLCKRSSTETIEYKLHQNEADPFSDLNNYDENDDDWIENGKGDEAKVQGDNNCDNEQRKENREEIAPREQGDNNSYVEDDDEYSDVDDYFDDPYRYALENLDERDSSKRSGTDSETDEADSNNEDFENPETESQSDLPGEQRPNNESNTNSYVGEFEKLMRKEKVAQILERIRRFLDLPYYCTERKPFTAKDLKALYNYRKNLALERENMRDLENRLHQFEAQFSASENISDRTEYLGKALKMSHARLLEYRKNDSKLKEILVTQEEIAEKLNTSNKNLYQEVEEKKENLERMHAKLQQVTNETVKFVDEFNADRRDLEIAKGDLLRMFKLNQIIIANFIPKDELKIMENRLRYNEDTDEWGEPVSTGYLNSENSSSYSDNQIVTDKIKTTTMTTARRKTTTGDDDDDEETLASGLIVVERKRAMIEQINLISLVPENSQRTTSEYRSPSVSPSIKFALERAIKREVEKDINIDAAFVRKIYDSGRELCRFEISDSLDPVKAQFRSEEQKKYPKARGLVPK